MEHYLSKSKILMKTKEGEFFYTNEMSGDEGDRRIIVYIRIWCCI